MTDKPEIYVTSEQASPFAMLHTDKGIVAAYHIHAVSTGETIGVAASHHLETGEDRHLWSGPALTPLELFNAERTAFRHLQLARAFAECKAQGKA